MPISAPGNTTAVKWVSLCRGKRKQAPVAINFAAAYGDESDSGCPKSISSDAPIEGYPNSGSDDRRVLAWITGEKSC
jgi:hypothetical protein